ncbi:hypothetical protein F4678DRAFT_467241 [Xylaria arbuscula]|nr:hypothetical protein F4678DRAFT_467241 [Xylaria arbuscula]
MCKKMLGKRKCLPRVPKLLVCLVRVPIAGATDTRRSVDRSVLRALPPFHVRSGGSSPSDFVRLLLQPPTKVGSTGGRGVGDRAGGGREREEEEEELVCFRGAVREASFESGAPS